VNCDVSYQDLVAFVSGDADAERREQIDGHAARCRRCRKRLEALGRSDAALKGLAKVAPSGGAILAARRAFSEVTRGRRAPEIMTLADVAEFLRVSPEQLGEMVEELPAFELAGQVRVRRDRLIEWVQQRERDYARDAAASWAARASSGQLMMEIN